MANRLKQRWREFRTAAPGVRFQERFERRKEERAGRTSRFLHVGAGVALIAAGIFFLPAPGPGTIVLLVGAGLIAQEWAWAARALDSSELQVRRIAGRVREIYRRSPPVVRVLAILVAVSAGGGIAYAAYQLVFAR